MYKDKLKLQAPNKETFLTRNGEALLFVLLIYLMSLVRQKIIPNKSNVSSTQRREKEESLVFAAMIYVHVIYKVST